MEVVMKVKQIMHKGVAWVTPETSLVHAARTMKRKDVGAIPVGKNDRLIGMVTDRDIDCRADDDIGKALRTMKNRKIRRLPVINQKKRMVGILSLGDVARKVAKSQC